MTGIFLGACAAAGICYMVGRYLGARAGYKVGHQRGHEQTVAWLLASGAPMPEEFKP